MSDSLETGLIGAAVDRLLLNIGEALKIDFGKVLVWRSIIHLLLPLGQPPSLLLLEQDLFRQIYWSTSRSLNQQ